VQIDTPDPSQFGHALEQVPDHSTFFWIIFLAALAALLAFYFLPTMIARERDIPKGGWVFWTNLFLGWTIFGWAVCLLWAACAVTREQDAYYRRMLRADLPLTSPPPR
jgi:hypothetical protein